MSRKVLIIVENLPVPFDTVFGRRQLLWLPMDIQSLLSALKERVILPKRK